MFRVQSKTLFLNVFKLNDLCDSTKEPQNQHCCCALTSSEDCKNLRRKARSGTFQKKKAK